MFASLVGFSQTDFNYQAIIKDANGMAVSGQSITMKFSIIYDAANGTVSYQETHQITTSVNGLINLVIGSGTPTSQTGDSWGAIDWGRPLFLKEEVNLGGGFTSLGTGRIYSVPIANYAAKAGAITGVMTGNVSASTVTATNINSGSISASGITAGTITATLFSGDGSGLTNVPILTFRNAENSFYLGQSPSNVVSGDALDNLSIGHQTLQFITTGDRNTAIGFNVLQRNTTGNDNIAIGARSQEGLGSGTSGGASRNNSLGVMTLMKNTTGDENTAIGHQSVYHNTTGSRNTGFGYKSLHHNTTGANNTAIGHTADVAANNLVNATAIGYGAVVGASNSIQLGNSSVNLVNTTGVVSATGITATGIVTATSFSGGVVSATGIITSGRVTATAFSGDGSGLTNLPSSGANNQIWISHALFERTGSQNIASKTGVFNGYYYEFLNLKKGSSGISQTRATFVPPSHWGNGNYRVTLYFLTENANSGNIQVDWGIQVLTMSGNNVSAGSDFIGNSDGAFQYGTTIGAPPSNLTAAAQTANNKRPLQKYTYTYNYNFSGIDFATLHMSRYLNQGYSYSDTYDGDFYVVGIKIEKNY